MNPITARIFAAAPGIVLAVATFATGGEVPDHTVNAFKNSIGMEMVRVLPGEFVMGCGKEPPRTNREFKGREWDEAPEHKVTITKDFYIGAFEVTNAQFEKFDPQHKRFRGQARMAEAPGARVSVADDEPVTFVTYDQALAFCEWLSKKEGKPYRLPTEAEWEYACRAGTETAFHTGDTLTAKQANLGRVFDKKEKDGKSFTMPVGSYPPNDFGLYDMHGNVAEWCLDWYGPYEAGQQTDPVGRATGCSRVARGGAYWLLSAGREAETKYMRSSNRAGYLLCDANRELGFRVVQASTPATRPLPEVKPLCMQGVKQDRPEPFERHKEPHYFDFTKQKKNPVQKSSLGPFFNHCHYTNIIACPNGDMLAVWDSIRSEYTKDATCAASRLPYGSDTWQPVSALFKVPDMNFMAGTVLSDGKRIYLFAPMALCGFLDAGIAMRTSDDNGATWNQPRFIYRRGGDEAVSKWWLQAVKTPVLGNKGELIVDGEVYQKHWGYFISKDRGKTWHVNGVCRKGVHPALHVARDGTWTAYVRAGSGETMPRYVSKDEGRTWTKGTPTPFPKASVGNLLRVLTLKSGATLLVTADNFRPTLVADRMGDALVALSDDEGKTWKHVRSVPVRGGMSAAQNLDGLIYVFGSHRACVTFNEAWVRQGKSADALGAARGAKAKEGATKKGR